MLLPAHFERDMAIFLGSAPFGVAITPDGAFAYVANRNPGSVSVIATATNTVVATVGVGTFPLGVAITPGEDAQGQEGQEGQEGEEGQQ